ncbi:unnamed protein product [Didymodactylos carnosus]|uniref:G-protein coupled receptors family 1 profile domain-containing protein n=1 Tax=Didymodactylos carnosus TaxID=1234261 RepID=A0A815J078_9BILA|nr:unnamed protein product [Didymodactylos carnosus]CAF1372621.1 unnamed protein product [Didymodactylos carnosus]CAF3972612.1 unnamed protein product [Didymodactylos carnosus]CAF4260534.1 unnamed protein product [Didymodactylos carnosus]
MNSSLCENCSSHLHTDETLILLVRLILQGYISFFIGICGIVGNIITIIVLCSKTMRTTPTNIYLTALSASNIFYLLIFIPQQSLKYMLGYKMYLNDKPFPYELIIAQIPMTAISNTILLSLIFLTVAVSIDRLIFIKYPLKAARICTRRNTLIVIFFIYAFSIIYCIPYWLEQYYDSETQSCRLTPIGKKIYKYMHIYIYIPVVNLIPFVTLTAINCIIIKSLIEMNRKKLSLGAKKTTENHITTMLVTVIIVFVVCQSPTLVLNIWTAISYSTATNTKRFHILNAIVYLLTVVQSSTNFLLYCFFGQKFRNTLIAIFCSYKQQKPRQQLLSDKKIRINELKSVPLLNKTCETHSTSIN